MALDCELPRSRLESSTFNDHVDTPRGSEVSSLSNEEADNFFSTVCA